MVIASSAFALSALGVGLAQTTASASKTTRKHQLASASAAIVPTTVAPAPPTTAPPPPPPPPSPPPPPPPPTTTTTAPKASAVVATSSLSGGVWAELRQCESGGNYQDDTGNGFYGAYQFDQQSWDSLGLSGLPSNAPPAVQDDAARRLQARDGWSPWPACSRKLGLN
jgi:hypothetical protein